MRNTPVPFPQFLEPPETIRDLRSIMLITLGTQRGIERMIDVLTRDTDGRMSAMRAALTLEALCAEESTLDTPLSPLSQTLALDYVRRLNLQGSEAV